MLRVGAEHFGGVASDNTGNTTLARSLLQEEFSWIIVLPDSCHHMSSLCKDIGSIKFFRPVIKKIRRMIKYFKNSNIASAHLRCHRKDLQIKRGLVSVGKTRFGTIYHSGESLRRCLKPIRQLCTEKVINIPLNFDNFSQVLAPIAKAITCLESTHSTVSDVYLFWLAVTATIHQIITEDITGLPD
ncbi:ribonuclease H-like domain-containing protein [Suillus ampliporus]|nr:ribonuclease H-like domain-containing protein [Suillus ampliporus]